MTSDQLSAFITEIKINSELQEKLNKVTSVEAVIEIAKEAGFSITAEDLPSHMKQAMSDAELESASGGTLVLATMGVVVGGAITGTAIWVYKQPLRQQLMQLTADGVGCVDCGVDSVLKLSSLVVGVASRFKVDDLKVLIDSLRFAR